MRVEPLHLADVVVEGATWPVIGWAIHVAQDMAMAQSVDMARPMAMADAFAPSATILVDTGMIDSTPQLDAEWHPTLRPWPAVGHVAAVINTHLHFDHCGGNRRFAGTPTFVQRAEYEAARAPDYLEEWVRFPGASYELLEGDAELFPGVRVLSTPGHSPGHQAVVVDADDGLTVLGGDVTYSMRELIDGATPSIRRIHALRPRRVYLAHHHRPWEPG